MQFAVSSFTPDHKIVTKMSLLPHWPAVKVAEFGVTLGSLVIKLRNQFLELMDEGINVSSSYLGLDELGPGISCKHETHK
jgi:hypothetical protein